MQKEELMLQKRLIELSKIAYQRGIVTYSDFLNLNDFMEREDEKKNIDRITNPLPAPACRFHSANGEL